MYLIEGNIGVGKSTFLRLMQEQLPEIQAIFEPVNAWSSSETTQSLLGNFYTNTPRWSYTMETFTMFARIKDHLNEHPHLSKLTIGERSLYSGYYCFAKNGYLQGQMQDIEWSLYSQWFDFLVPRINTPTGFIYLKSDPEKCFERTVKRNRTGESNIPLEYFKQIHHRHEEFLIKKQGVSKALEHVPLLILDASCEFEHNPEIISEYAHEVKQFIELTVTKDA